MIGRRPRLHWMPLTSRTMTTTSSINHKVARLWQGVLSCDFDARMDGMDTLLSWNYCGKTRRVVSMSSTKGISAGGDKTDLSCTDNRSQLSLLWVQLFCWGHTENHLTSMWMHDLVTLSTFGCQELSHCLFSLLITSPSPKNWIWVTLWWLIWKWCISC